MSQPIKIDESRDVVMIDDHEGDLQIARLCFAQSRLSNPWVSFTDSADALFHFRIAASNPSRLPALVIIKADMKPWNAEQTIGHLRKNFGAELPFSVVVMVNQRSDIAGDSDLSNIADGILLRPRLIKDYLEFFDGLRIRNIDF